MISRGQSPLRTRRGHLNFSGHPMSKHRASSELAPSPWWVWTASALAILAVAVLDGSTGGHMSVLALYLLPVAMAAWVLPAWAALSVVVVASVGWWAAQVWGTDPTFEGWWAVQNALMRGLVFGAVGWLVWLLRRTLRISRDVARVDVVTGLINRSGFLTSATAALADAREGRRAVTLTMIDVAGLRSINRRFGHARGDLVLALTAQAARSSEPTAESMARVGSDEFAVLELGRSVEQARRDAAALAGRLAETSRLVGCVVGYRVVCAHSELPPLSLDDLMTYAEERLDRAASASPASSTGVVFAMYPEVSEEAAGAGAPRGVA